jgi:hypothetical protein
VAKAFQEFARDMIGICRAAAVAAQKKFAAAAKGIFENFRCCRDVARAGMERRITLNESGEAVVHGEESVLVLSALVLPQMYIGSVGRTQIVRLKQKSNLLGCFLY